jgi:hypothetical protein
MINSIISFHTTTTTTILQLTAIPLTTLILLSMANRGSLVDKVQNLTVLILLYTAVLVELNINFLAMLYILIEFGTVLFLVATLSGLINVFVGKNTQNIRYTSALVIASLLLVCGLVKSKGPISSYFFDAYVVDNSPNEFIAWYMLIHSTSLKSLCLLLIFLVAVTHLIICTTNLKT